MQKWYPDYRTPHLSYRKREGRLEVILSDGRPLFDPPLPEDATEEEMLERAHREILMLACRNLVNIIPLCKPYNEELPYIVLDADRHYQARYIAFLRGRIPYISMPQLRKVSGPEWGIVRMNVRDGKMEAFPGTAKFNGLSCDSACEMLPEQMHNNVYWAGKPGGGRGFNKGDIYPIAADYNIVIDGIPRHALEDRKNLNKEPRLPKMPANDVPAPPQILDTRSAENRFKLSETALTKKACGLNNYRSAFERMAANAADPIFRIGEDYVNRYQFMDYLIWALGEGHSLESICKGKDGTPSLLEIDRWSTIHPDFGNSLKSAKRVQAIRLADKAIQVIDKAVVAVDSASDKDEMLIAKGKLSAAKLQHDVYMKRAALDNEDFRDKQVIQTEDLSKKTETDLKRQALALLMQHQGLIEELAKNTLADGGTVEGEVLNETGTPE